MSKARRYGIAAACCLMALQARAEQDLPLSPDPAGTVKWMAEKAMPADPDAWRTGPGEASDNGRAAAPSALPDRMPDSRQGSRAAGATSGKSGRTMVQVDVQVLEIIRNRDLDVGLDWEKLAGPAGQLAASASAGPLQDLGRLERGKMDFVLKALLASGEAKILARPKLLALSGRPASFSAGGEIPVSVTTATGAAHVEWKKYGVSLEILARAEGSGLITAEIRAEVSDADFTRLVQGNPALKTRWAATTIQVESNGTAVIGGLIQEKNHMCETGLPLLCEIPVLGYLFQSTRVVSEESELVIFVTPHVLGP